MSHEAATMRTSTKETRRCILSTPSKLPNPTRRLFRQSPSLSTTSRREVRTVGHLRALRHQMKARAARAGASGGSRPRETPTMLSMRARAAAVTMGRHPRTRNSRSAAERSPPAASTSLSSLANQPSLLACQNSSSRLALPSTAHDPMIVTFVYNRFSCDINI